MKRNLLTTLLCLIAAMATMAQPKHYPADYKSPTTPDGMIVVAYVTSNAKAELPDPFAMTHINYAFGHVNVCTGNTPVTTLKAQCATSSAMHY